MRKPSPTPAAQFLRVRATVVAGLLAAATAVLAQDAGQPVGGSGGAPKAGTAPTEADYDVPYKRLFLAAVEMYDMQLSHATRCEFPDASFKNEDGWYLNVGDQEGTSEDVFDVASLIGQGR